MVAMERELQGLLWFGAGFALGAILSVSYQAVRYVPMAVAFGLLCFGCGLVLFLFLNLLRREGSVTKSFESVLELKRELEEQKKSFETEKEDWEDERAVWEATHSDDSGAEGSR